jgi:choline dehydrogenase-like flavoprotein
LHQNTCGVSLFFQNPDHVDRMLDDLSACRPGVVAPDFKVHRTANLRVVDASVIPLTFSVAPLATVFAIAEKVTNPLPSSNPPTHVDAKCVLV